MMFEITGDIRITDVIRVGKRRYKITKILSEEIKENEKVYIVDTKEIN